jgi:hypothetical protein
VATAGDELIGGSELDYLAEGAESTLDGGAGDDL